MSTDHALSIPLYRFTDLGRHQTAIWKPWGLAFILLVSLLHPYWDDLFLLFAGGLVLLKPMWMLVCEQHALQTRHVLYRDAQGHPCLERQRCFRGQILHRRTLNLNRYTWLQVFEPGDGTVTLRLGNACYETHLLASIRPGTAVLGDGTDIAEARCELLALARRISWMTGIESRDTSLA